MIKNAQMPLEETIKIEETVVRILNGKPVLDQISENLTVKEANSRREGRISAIDDCIVQVTSKGNFQIREGQGFFASAEGIIFTAYHNISNADPDKLTIRSRYGSTYRIKPDNVWVDPSHDIAILYAEMPTVGPILRFPIDEKTELEDVLVKSFFKGEILTQKGGLINFSDLLNLPEGCMKEVYGLCDMRSFSGMSGSPLICQDRIKGVYVALVTLNVDIYRTGRIEDELNLRIPVAAYSKHIIDLIRRI